MADRLPRLFGKYILLKSLARGGMGEIYLAATDQGGGLSKLCVIKKIIAEKTDRAKVNRFLDEAKVVLRLSHANLVPTFDAGDAAGELFIAMELVEGKDLREIWNRCVRTRTRIPLDVALQVVRETARALAYVHTHGDLRLVHRDVAPPNILLSYYGEVKLTDFGLARSAIKQEHTAPGVVFGRASYLAPEQARGEVADGRTDVYSLGIVLWELLTGQPYLQLAGLDPVTSLAVVRNPKTVSPSTQAPWIAPELDEIVLKALAVERPKRFQSADEMRRALSDVMTRVAPRADAERVAEFLKGLYHEVRLEEAAERLHFLEEILPRWRGERPASRLTPTTDVVPDLSTGVSAQAAASVAASMVRERGLPLEVEREAGARQVSQRQDTVVAQVAEPASETLHASALRVRNVSAARRPPPGEASGAETKIWRRKPKPQPEPDAAGDTFVGRIIDSRYRIRHRIGEGGMGTVYLAEHVEIGKTVAVKILRRQYSGDKQLVERFRREARAASRVGHPHIIEVNDFGATEDGCAFFVMEHLEGIDLADLIAHEGQLEPGRVMRIAIQICRALGAAHTAGIIHRDLKPENVFLVAREGQTDFVKVLDFGIARNTSSEAWRLTNPGMTMGTPEYMAPEQVLGRPADARTDVYALGALMYEMLIGGAPFRATTGDTMLDQKMRPLQPLREQRADVPPALDAAVARAMAPDVGNRPQTMAALEYELTKIVFGRARAVTELLGLRELTAPQGETPAIKGEAPTIGATPPIGPASPAPAPAFAALGAVVVPARLGSDEMEAFLEADLSPRPQLTRGDARVGTTRSAGAMAVAASSAAPHKRSPAAREVRAVDAFGAVKEHDHLGVGVGFASGVPGIAAIPALEGGPAGPGPGRDRSRRIAAIMVLVALVVSIAWFSRQGRSNVAVPELRKSSDVAPVVRATSSGAAAPPSTSGPSSSPRAAAVPSRWRSTSPGTPAAAGSPPPLAAAGAPTMGPAATSTGAPSPSASSPSSPAVSPPPALAGRSGPEVVPTKPLDKAREALSAGNSDEAIGLLRTNPPSTDPAVKALLIDALVASGTKAMAAYRWGVVIRHAREAVALVEPGASSRGAHLLLADALFAFNDFENSLAEYQRALGEAPRDARLRRHLARARQQAQTRAAVAAARAGGGLPSVSGAGTAAPSAESPSLPVHEPAAE